MESPVEVTNGFEVIGVMFLLYTYDTLRWQVAFVALHPITIGSNMLMQSTRKIRVATFLSMTRQGVYFIPAILILPRLLGLTGVEISQTVADICSAITAIPFVIVLFKKMDDSQN